MKSRGFIISFSTQEENTLGKLMLANIFVKSVISVKINFTQIRNKTEERGSFFATVISSLCRIFNKYFAASLKKPSFSLKPVDTVTKNSGFYTRHISQLLDWINYMTDSCKNDNIYPGSLERWNSLITLKAYIGVQYCCSSELHPRVRSRCFLGTGSGPDFRWKRSFCGAPETGISPLYRTGCHTWSREQRPLPEMSWLRFQNTDRRINIYWLSEE